MPKAPREQGLGLTLSGGGYRAMVYHIGAVIRLQELDLLKQVSRVSSVSGGSITAGVLGLHWNLLTNRTNLFANFVEPLRELAATTIDWPSVVKGLFLPGNVGNYVAARYDDILFKGKTLQDLPDAPRFVINSTNLGTGTLWRFSKPYMRDYRVGEVQRPTIRLADAVAASSAFPPVLSPFKLKLTPSQFSVREPGVADDFFNRVVLTDGGVYDNYGLEPVWDRYTDVLVSDGGGIIAPQARPSALWPQMSYRVINIIQQQVHALRSREMVDSFQASGVKGCLWSIQTSLGAYPAAPIVTPPSNKVAQLAATPTRLKRLSDELQEQLINLGYIGCDAAIRSYYLTNAPKPVALPFPNRAF